MTTTSLERLAPYIRKPTMMKRIIEVLREAEGPLYVGDIVKRYAESVTLRQYKDIARALGRLAAKGMVERRLTAGRKYKGMGQHGWSEVMTKDYLYLLKEEYYHEK